MYLPSRGTVKTINALDGQLSQLNMSDGDDLVSTRRSTDVERQEGVRVEEERRVVAGESIINGGSVRRRGED
jgi:hypothetical protein